MNGSRSGRQRPISGAGPFFFFHETGARPISRSAQKEKKRSVNMEISVGRDDVVQTGKRVTRPFSQSMAFHLTRLLTEAASFHSFADFHLSTQLKMPIFSTNFCYCFNVFTTFLGQIKVRQVSSTALSVLKFQFKFRAPISKNIFNF